MAKEVYLESNHHHKTKKWKYATALLTLLLVGSVAIMLGGRSITSRITGETILTESQAVNTLVEYINTKYGSAEFYRSEDLGNVYLVVLKREGQEYNFYVTRDGKYFTTLLEEIKLEVEEEN